MLIFVHHLARFLQCHEPCLQIQGRDERPRSSASRAKQDERAARPYQSEASHAIVEPDERAARPYQSEASHAIVEPDERAARPYRSKASRGMVGTRGPRVRSGIVSGCPYQNKHKSLFLCLLLIAFAGSTPRVFAESDEPALTPEPAEKQNAEPVSEERVRLPSDESLVPFRDSWIYQTILGFRPADGLTSPVNPPRFSWPYLEEVLLKEDTTNDSSSFSISPTVFTLQIARDAEFAEPEVHVVDTPYNFFNALPPLEAGKWFWRVGYGAAPDQRWSTARVFVIDDTSLSWDRSGIETAAAELAKRPHPRIGPVDSDWAGLLARLQADPAASRSLSQLLNVANRTLQQPWWSKFPETDKPAKAPTNRDEQLKYINMLRELVVVAYAYRLTGDTKYQGSLERIQKMASWPMGGLLSPEAEHAAMGGHTKMPSQAAELFAAVYDMFYNDLDEAERKLLLNAVTWRIDTMFRHPSSIIWKQADRNMRHFGLAYSAGSHPYQNFSWAVPAILLTAGDSEVADRLLPLALNYLTAVTVPDGPDEGYNEGHGYGNEKAETMLRATLLAEMLLPGLHFGKNPAVRNLVDWFAFLHPGARALPWGDTWQDTARGVGGANLLRLTYLTGSPLAKQLWIERAQGAVADNPAGGYSRPWFELAAWDIYRDRLESIEAAGSQSGVLFLPEAGWLFVQAPPIRNSEDYQKSVGMQFQMRPRGGYGHSYASDGSFFWHAFGEDLTSGGGWQSWASLGFSRSPMSHNTLLVDGRGHETLNQYQPQRAYAARPLVFEEGPGYVYWAADLTEGYRHLGPMVRIHRHVLFVDGRWFFIFDDLATEPEAKPTRFTWLYHVMQDVPLKIDATAPGFDYQVGEVRAHVRFGNPPASIRVENRQGREGYKNPITGEDHYEDDMKRAGSRGMFKRFLKAPLMQHNLWVTSNEASNKFRFLTALLAAGPGMEIPEVAFDGTDRATLTFPDGRTRSVSFHPDKEADIVIDVDRVRQHAINSRPANLPAATSRAQASENGAEEP